MTKGIPTPKAKLTGNRFEIDAFGRSWILIREFDLEEMWAAMGENGFADERIPYWTEFWPASLVLAEWLMRQKQRLKDCLCLDLGCGLGFTALIGQWLGATVLACDYEPDSLRAARINAQANDIDQPAWICMDWRKPAVAPLLADHIWGGDILYEKRACQPIIDLIDLALKPGGAAWMADPGRGVFQYFEELARKKGWKPQKVFSQKAGATRPQEAAIPVAIWEIGKDG